MAFVVSNLTTFTERATEMLTSKLLFSNSVDGFSLEDDVQGSKYLNLLSSKVYPQAGTCGLSQSGSTTFDQVTLSVVPISYKLQYCFEDLYAKGLKIERQALAKSAEPMVEEALTNENINQITKNLWYNLWVGNISTSDMFDGWAHQILDSASRVIATDAFISSTARTFAQLSGSGIQTQIQEMCNKAVATDAIWAAAGEGKLQLFVAPNVFNLYRQYLISANLFRFGPTDLAVKRMDIVGYEGLIELVEVPELTLATTVAPIMILTYNKNLFIGASLMDNLTSPKAEYVVDVVADYVYFKSSLRLGCAVGVIAHCITNK